MKALLQLRLVPLALLGALASCDRPASDSPEPAPTAAPVAAEPEKPEEKKPASEDEPTAAAPAESDLFKNGATSGPIDIGDFGSEEPVEPDNMHTRGILTFTGDDGTHTTQQHWEQWDWSSFEAKRWGRYHIRLTYTMQMATLPMQFKVAEQRLKKTLKAAHDPRKVYLGTVYIADAGPHPFAIYTAAKGVTSKLEVREVAFIPAPEGDPVAQNGKDAITLSASSATTWSENMRYEPKPEKQCLGFWTSEDDFAEWEFDVKTPGTYEVIVTHGCGGGNHGSEVAVLAGDDRLTFTVEDTGGFQSWKDVVVGKISLAAAGPHQLMINPVNKTQKAVLDVQKVVLKPVN
jgi:hypothetical protein